MGEKPLRLVPALAVAALLLTGCAGGSSGAAAPAPTTKTTTTTASTASATPSPTRTAAVRVGEPAACGLLLRGEAPAQHANDLVMAFVKDPTGKSTDKAELHTVIGQLGSLAERAPADWGPYLEALQHPLQELEDVLTTGANRELNFEDYRAAGLELATRCGA